MSTFHNTYHFIPIKKEGRIGDLDAKSFPANRGHVTHDRYCDGTYSGRIVCRLTTETPIFVGSERAKGASADTADEVRHFELNGRPAIPASTLRGLFSSIAEAASNSALRILDDVKYSYRRLMDPFQTEMHRPLSAIGMVFVDRDTEGRKQYRLLPLTLPLMEFKNAQTATLDAHWQRLYSEPNLKVYIGNADSIRNENYIYRTFTNDHKRFYGLKLKRRSWDNGSQGVVARDDDMNLKGGRFMVAQLPLQEGSLKQRNSVPKPWDEIPDDDKPLYVRGILRVLGCGRDRSDIPKTKKHELFIPYPEEAQNWTKIPIQDDAIERFYDLARQRTEASEGNSSPWPYEPIGTERNEDPEKYGQEFRLKTGDLVWFRPAMNKAEVSEISLSSIWRGRVETTDNKAATTHTFFSKIDSDLLPFNSARTMITLAEQLFGFVNGTKDQARTSPGALAGRVYFSHAQHEGFRNAGNYNLETDQQGLDKLYLDAVTLRILDAPKPPSPSLYFKKATGKPGYIAKRELKPGQHIPQGRKFYLHHRDKEINQPGQEPWRTQNDERLQQKVRINPLRPRAVFYFHLDFDNLSSHELGLLLFSLKPADEFRHKIGMGKPLGLGRVNVEPVGLFRINRQKRYTSDELFAARYSETWISTGEDSSLWPAAYDKEKAATGNSIGVTDLRDAFAGGMDPDIKTAIQMIGNPKALRAPVQTPLVEGGDPEDETFKWFVENDRRAASKNSDEKPASLAPLPDSSGRMPLLPHHRED